MVKIAAHAIPWGIQMKSKCFTLFCRPIFSEIHPLKIS